MAEERSKKPPGKKKERPVVKKVMGRAQKIESPDVKKPGPPAYEHG